MNLKTLNLLPGHYRTNFNSTEILPCLNEEHCTGGSDPSSYCAPGYTGPLCAVCSSGFAAVGAGETLSCNECVGSATATAAAGIGAIFLALVVAVFYRLKEKNENVKRRAQSFESAMEFVSEKFEKVRGGRD
jgi:hypothetical protein